MGMVARRVTRWSTAVVLVGTIASGAAGTAFGYAEGGVNVPDSTFRQNTGTQEVDVALTAPAVGSDEKFIVWPFYSTAVHWLVGVTADPSTGATCAYDVGQWECDPGHQGWQAGELHILVNTAKAMDCGLHAGVCETDEIAIQSLPDAGDHNGLPDGQPLSVLGNVVIMPTSAPWHGPTPEPVYKPVVATTAAAPAPATSVDAVKTSVTVSSAGSSTWVYVALAILILIGVAFPLVYRRLHRRG